MSARSNRVCRVERIIALTLAMSWLAGAAWQRQGRNFPPYPQCPQSQGPWNALYGQGAKYIGLIENGGMAPIR